MNDEQIRRPEDAERVSRLTTAIPPQVSDEPAQSSGDDAVVLEYETRYRGVDGAKSKRKGLPRSYSTSRISDDERLWASVAHASVWITALGGIFTIGAIIPVSIFIPLVIYFLFRKRSDFVAFHALQAFVIQLLGTVGAFTLLMLGGAVWGLGMVIAAISVLVLVGFILVPVWGIVGVVLLLAVVALPLGMVFYGTIAAISTYKGDDYRYPFIARWVDRQLAGGLMNTA
ncbi:MAG: DUF4870 domain-containing protein [Anaerolineae bacterium]|nr:DUF4870 domain-containing protein [Anaerolineae bacterium]